MADDPSSTPLSALSFEQALQQLDEVLQAMEGSLPLEQLVEKYQQGTRLLEHCRATLQQAQSSLEQIELQQNGQQNGNPAL